MRILTVAAAALAAGVVSFGALTTVETETALAQTALNFNDKSPAGDHGRLGVWESVCETGEPLEGLHAAKLDGLQQGQCHLRYIDIFNAGGHVNNHEELGMVAAFVTPEKKGVRVEFGIAPGLSFETGGFHLSRNGFAVWNLDKYDCLDQGICTFTGPAAEALLTAFSDPNATTLEMRLDFTDKSGQQHSRQWQMMPFSKAFADFAVKQNIPTM